MQQSEIKYKHLSSKHQIFKENNNNYKKHWMLQMATKGSNHNQVSREYKISEK